ncbi:MAG TPA: hypothetical protein VKC55_02905 [Actinomycetota bacterium]|nr:hypothetical protein [Actinomycetota bacterium]
MNGRRARTTIIAAGLALVAAACGGSNATTTGATGASKAPATTGPSATQSSSATTSPSAQIAANPAPVAKGQSYQPNVPPPSEFVATVDNQYMPWIPGTKMVFEGVSDGQRERNVVFVTDRTEMVMGVATTVVHDQVFSANGDLAEDTFDWYAQDAAGNVWYFGEDTAEYKNGSVTSTAGSWKAGVDGAQPGVVMLAQPTVGEAYHQEFRKGEAEDVGKVIAVGGSVDVPYGPFDKVVVTEDTTPLEPQIVEHKFYAPGIGVVIEHVIRGAQEISKLVSFTPPA